MDTDTLTSLKKAAQREQEYITEIRRHLHAHPELRFEEEKTLSYIETRVAEIIHSNNIKNLQLLTGFHGGLLVDLTLNPEYDRIILRADIDAVPVPEKTGLSFSSKVPNVSHACGHDVHVAMLLGAMKAIADGKIVPKHNIRFVFQRAEENPSPISGGKMLVEEGVCDGISKAYSLHIWATGAAGTFESRPGGLLANSDRFKAAVKCKGGHVAFPNQGSNATDIAVDICSSMKGFSVRTLGPFETVSMVPASLNAGVLGASNVRPSDAEIWFANRHFLNPEKRAFFQEAITNKIKAVVATYPDASVEVSHVLGHPALKNDPASFEHVSSLLASAEEKVNVIDPIFGGEDFAYYLNAVPGSAWFLGANQEGCGGHHQPTFNPDESVFWKGVLYWLLLATN